MGWCGARARSDTVIGFVLRGSSGDFTADAAHLDSSAFVAPLSHRQQVPRISFIGWLGKRFMKTLFTGRGRLKTFDLHLRMWMTPGLPLAILC